MDDWYAVCTMNPYRITSTKCRTNKLFHLMMGTQLPETCTDSLIYYEINILKKIVHQVAFT